MNKVLINVIGFQAGWFACVLGAAHGVPWLGPLLTLPILGWHLFHARIARSELSLIVAGTLFGGAFDQLLLSQGWVQYLPSAWPANLLPLWMVSLWLLFCTTLNVSLRWLRGRNLTAMLLGLFGGPAAYWSGAKLGAVILLQPMQLLTALAMGWVVLMPCLIWLSRKLDGYANPLDVRTVQVV